MNVRMLPKVCLDPLTGACFSNKSMHFPINEKQGNN